ncbi:cadherin-related family member 1a isoform X2 [Brachyhypopomus gauderio]|uniref:cadherin-related family member 1a isoform X2 n=1 Tax=Brachyhypopomus gauderio TaxID=698409 RepID=UPI004041408E
MTMGPTVTVEIWHCSVFQKILQRVGTQIYVLNGTDPEGQPVRYGLAFDPGSKAYFHVDPKSGVVTLMEELDREGQDVIEVLVSISDGLNQVVEKVRVFVMDANDEHPQFKNMPAIVDVPENTPSGSSIYKVHAVDRDTGSGGSVSYFLKSSDPHNKFAVDRHSGVLRIKAGEALDYERSRTHFITVVAKDGGGNYNGREKVMSSSATLTINVLDNQDSPPSFVGTPYFGYVYEVSSPGSEIFSVLAKDGDEENPNQIVYSFESGADGVFDINRTSGSITLITSPAHLRREIFNIKIKASEVNSGGNLTECAITTVTIRVMDVNNHPPAFYGQGGPQNTFELTIYEHPPEGEILRGLKITVNDSDQGTNAKFSLKLVGPGHMLHVVPETVLNEAQVTILVEDSAALDYERAPFLTFKLLAEEIDTPEKFSATADIVIHLLDTNDNAPKFTSDFYIARVPENSPGGSNVVSVTAMDPDSGLWGVVKYSIFGSGSDMFVIHLDSGFIYTQSWARLDAEVKAKYNFYVKAEDTEGKYSLAEVFVTVLDLNDHPPEFDENYLEKTMILGATVKIEAIDEDAEEPNNVIEYSITKAEPDNIFDINANTGEIKLKSYVTSMDIVQNITNQKDCTWSLVVQARDRGYPPFSTTTIVKIGITETTQHVGPLAFFFMQSRENPFQMLGFIVSVIVLMVVVTALISMAIFIRTKKSNKVSPSRRIIRKRRRQRNFQNPFKQENSGEKNRVAKEPEVSTAQNVNCNNNSVGSLWSCIAAPRAPVPPPPPVFSKPAGAPRLAPTVPTTMLSKPKRKGCRSQETRLNTALVSELKLRLEQKKLTNRY